MSHANIPIKLLRKPTPFYERLFNKFIDGIKFISCFKCKIPGTASLNESGELLEIPLLQYFIFIFWTLFVFHPNLIGGPTGLHIFQGVILCFMSMYLLARFSVITKEHEKIEECDVWIVSTVAFVLLVDYLYNDVFKTVSQTVTGALRIAIH
jgi:hypothetical protein